ncbi:MAG: hypothetical protein JSW08_03140 [archaeon]|nr:MAG: hypothetical protein JSW08_03140 [archaeon]
MEFIGLISTGKGTWGQVAGLVKRGSWDKVILVCPEFAKQRIKQFDFAKYSELYFFNFDKTVKELVGEIREKLKDKIKGIEVALNIASGSGKEHIALISALLKIPVGVKFVVLTREGITEL